MSSYSAAQERCICITRKCLALPLQPSKCIYNSHAEVTRPVHRTDGEWVSGRDLCTLYWIPYSSNPCGASLCIGHGLSHTCLTLASHAAISDLLLSLTPSIILSSPPSLFSTFIYSSLFLSPLPSLFHYPAAVPASPATPLFSARVMVSKPTVTSGPGLVARRLGHRSLNRFPL